MVPSGREVKLAKQPVTGLTSCRKEPDSTIDPRTYDAFEIVLFAYSAFLCYQDRATHSQGGTSGSKSPLLVAATRRSHRVRRLKVTPGF